MNSSTQAANCRLYSAAVYGFDHPPTMPNFGGRDQLSYSRQRPATAVGYSAGDAPYASAEAAAELYDSRSRCREELSGVRPADYRHSVTTSPYFGSGAGGSATDLVYQCSSGYSTPSVVRGDCYVFPTSYGPQMDFRGCGPVAEHIQDCAVAEDDRRLLQSSTFDDGVPRACRTLQRHQQLTTHHHQQQEQLTRPTTYKWMTIKRGPSKTALGMLPARGGSSLPAGLSSGLPRAAQGPKFNIEIVSRDPCQLTSAIDVGPAASEH